MKNRYLNNPQKRNAYLNACDCIYYGYGKQAWNSCGVSEKETEEIWNQAFEDMANEF